MNNKKYITNTNEKTVKTHMIFILTVCILFGIINLTDGHKIVGILIILCGISISIINILMRNRVEKSTRGFMLSIFQL